jgi:ectoine hydroxylase
LLNPVAAPGVLTELDKFMIEAWGYIIIPNVLNEDEIAECLEASKRIHKAAGTTGFGQVGRGYETEESLERHIDHPAIIPKIRGLYGDHFILQAGWNTVQPAGGAAGGWHQDGSGAFDFKKLGAPIPLIQLRASFLLTDQSKERMGNMELIPGSHRSLVSLPGHLKDETGSFPISHVICAPAGSVLLFHNAVWHRTYYHDLDFDRYTMHYIYSPPWVSPSDRLENNIDFLNRTTPLRRALMGEFKRPEAPYGLGYDKPPFEESEAN